MNIAHKLTFSRIFLTPFFFIVYQITLYNDVYEKTGFYLLLGIFIIAEVTDLLDGWVARRFNLVSETGKLLDPFSDVISRLTFFFCFLLEGLLSPYIFIIIFWREVSMTFVRLLLAQSQKRSLGANWAGKAKAVLYFAASLYGMFLLAPFNGGTCPLYIRDIADYLFGAAAVAAVVSFLIYLAGIQDKRELFK